MVRGKQTLELSTAESGSENMWCIQRQSEHAAPSCHSHRGLVWGGTSFSLTGLQAVMLTEDPKALGRDTGQCHRLTGNMADGQGRDSKVDTLTNTRVGVGGGRRLLPLMCCGGEASHYGVLLIHRAGGAVTPTSMQPEARQPVLGCLTRLSREASKGASAARLQ